MIFIGMSQPIPRTIKEFSIKTVYKNSGHDTGSHFLHTMEKIVEQGMQKLLSLIWA